LLVHFKGAVIEDVSYVLLLLEGSIKLSIVGILLYQVSEQ
jgi:hypothetical protein